MSTLLLNHDKRGRLTAHHALLPNMYHDIRGRHSVHHTLLPNMYHDNKVGSAHHTLLINLYMITESGSLLTSSCCLTCTMITDVGTLLTTPCYLTYILYGNRCRLSAYHSLGMNMYMIIDVGSLSPHIAT